MGRTIQDTIWIILNADNILCWDADGVSSLIAVPSAKISIPPVGKVLLIELHTLKTSPNSRRASKTQEADKKRKDFLSPIFFRHSTDNHTPKLFQCNCVMYVLQT